MIPDFTIVCGVDRKHLEQLSWTWPTWKRHKPSLLNHDMVVFCDREQVGPHEVRSVVDHPRLFALSWPPIDIDWGQPTNEKWDNPQRYKMLSGFVHVPSSMVQTPYWLKIDTDVVVTGKDDWIDPAWFVGNPAIVSHKWTFTKPPDQMLKLDQWVEENKALMPVFDDHPPLNLVPLPGAERLGHKRIISRVAFFDTGFTNLCAQLASRTCGLYQLPCKSQDGFMFYVAKRLGLEIKRISLKDNVGFQHWSTSFNVYKHSRVALGESV